MASLRSKVRDVIRCAPAQVEQTVHDVARVQQSQMWGVGEKGLCDGGRSLSFGEDLKANSSNYREVSTSFHQ